MKQSVSVTPGVSTKCCYQPINGVDKHKSSRDQPTGDSTEQDISFSDQPTGGSTEQDISSSDQPTGDSTEQDISSSDQPTGDSTEQDISSSDQPAGDSTEQDISSSDQPTGDSKESNSSTIDCPTDGAGEFVDSFNDQPKDLSRCQISYGWVIVAAEFLLFFVTGSIVGSQALFYPAFREAFDTNFEKVGWFIALAKFTQAITSLFCGAVVDRYGSRKVCLLGCLLQSLGMLISSFSPNIYLLFITYTLIWGPGLGLIYTSAPVIIQKWFTKNRSLAHSLCINGIPCGFIASGPLTHFLLETYSWRGALLVYSGIGLHGLVSAALLRHPIKKVTKDSIKLIPTTDSEKSSHNKPEMHLIIGDSQNLLTSDIKTLDDENLQCCPVPTEPTKQKRLDKKSCSTCKKIWQLLTKLIDISLLKNSSFVLFFLARSLANYGYQTSKIHIPSRALEMGMPKYQVQYLPIFSGVSSAVGTIASGVAGRKIDLATLTGIGMGFHGLFQILIGFTGRDFIWNAVATSFSNFMIGVFLALEPTLMTDIVGIYRLGRAYGLYSLVVSISALTAVPFSGWMYDISGNYNIPFYVTGALAVVAGLLMFVIVYRTERRKCKYNIDIGKLDA